MEIVCIDKKAFDEICSHFNEFEIKLTEKSEQIKKIAKKK